MVTSFLSALPLETVLDIISYVSWSQQTRSALSLTCRGLEDVMRNYESSIARDVIATQYTTHSLCLLGLVRDDLIPTYNLVDEIQTRQKTVSDIQESCLSIKKCHCVQSLWMVPRLTELRQVGLGLLYRLADAGCNESRAMLLKSLPTTSLAAVLFTLLLSMRHLRAVRPDILSGEAYARNQPVEAWYANDIELACEELLLQRGPGYLASLLHQSAAATGLLEKEFNSMEERQMPLQDDMPRPPTLIATLRRSFAASLGCKWTENDARMWDLLNSRRIKGMDENDALKIIRGEPLSE